MSFPHVLGFDRVSLRLVLALVGLSLAWPQASAEDPPPVETLIARLGGATSAEREAATQRLQAIGVPALKALKGVAKDADPEIRRRARALIAHIERQAEGNHLRGASRVRLHFEDVPLVQAAAEVARLGGIAIRVDTPVAARRVTLDTPEMPFWEAFDRFCASAQVVDTPPESPRVVDEGRVVVSGFAFGRNVALSSTDITRPLRPERILELTLREQDKTIFPTHYSGAVRVRALPPGREWPTLASSSSERLIVLDTVAEGRFLWDRLVAVRVERAIDEKGTQLAVAPVVLRPPVPTSSTSINGIPLELAPEDPGPGGRLVPVRLGPAAQFPKTLRELAGIAIGQVRTAPEEVVTIPGILKTAGKTFRGQRGGAIRVLTVNQEEGGLVRLKVMVEPVARGMESRTLPFQGTLVVNGRYASTNDDLLNTNHFSLLDGRGKPWRNVTAIATGRRDANATEYEFSYAPEADQGEAERFVYRDRRATFLEVPFVLSNVPLEHTVDDKDR